MDSTTPRTDSPFNWLLPYQLENANDELVGLENELNKLAPKLGNLKMPITIMHAPNDDAVPFANVTYMENRFTGSSDLKTIIFDDKGHQIPWNSAATVMNEIKRIDKLLTSRGK